LAQAQARLTIVNQSQRLMSVKVMQARGVEDILNRTVVVGPMESRTIYFTESGEYFTKTKATRVGTEPIFRRGQPFVVHTGPGGFTVLTLTYTIAESTIPIATGGTPISQDEFDRDLQRRQ
jgi:hypothetical protein